MARILKLFLLSLCFTLVLTFLQVSGINTVHADDPTPTPTYEVPEDGDPLLDLIGTPTPSAHYSCNPDPSVYQGLNPDGLTPLWLFYCGQCLPQANMQLTQTAMPTEEPLILLPTVTPGGAGDPPGPGPEDTVSWVGEPVSHSISVFSHNDGHQYTIINELIQFQEDGNILIGVIFAYKNYVVSAYGAASSHVRFDNTGSTVVTFPTVESPDWIPEYDPYYVVYRSTFDATIYNDEFNNFTSQLETDPNGRIEDGGHSYFASGLREGNGMTVDYKLNCYGRTTSPDSYCNASATMEIYPVWYGLAPDIGDPEDPPDPSGYCMQPELITEPGESGGDLDFHIFKKGVPYCVSVLGPVGGIGIDFSGVNWLPGINIPTVWIPNAFICFQAIWFGELDILGILINLDVISLTMAMIILLKMILR